MRSDSEEVAVIQVSVERSQFITFLCERRKRIRINILWFSKTDQSQPYLWFGWVAYRGAQGVNTRPGYHVFLKLLSWLKRLTGDV